MVILQWELHLARRLAFISIIGGSISWTLRQYRLGMSADFLTYFLAGYLLLLATLLLLRIRYHVMVIPMVVGMIIIGLWVSANLVELRPGPLLVMLTAITLAAAYYRFRISFMLILATTAALIVLGYFSAQNNTRVAPDLPP